MHENIQERNHHLCVQWHGWFWKVSTPFCQQENISTSFEQYQVLARHLPSHWSCVGDMQDSIEFMVCLSQQTYEVNEEDSTAFVDRCLTHWRLRKFAKCPSWVSFSANSLWPVDQGIIWAANRISQGALFWDCCKNWKSNEDLYRLSLHDAVTMLSVVWSAVTWETITDCSVTAGFSANAVASGQDDDDDDNSVGDRQSCDI